MEDIDKTQPSSNLNVSPEDEAPTIRPRTEEERKRGCRIGDFICGRYRIDSVLGRGGMGVVYKCHDRTSGINVAVKTILPGVGQSQYELDLTKENFQLVCKLHHQYIANYNSLEQDEQLRTSGVPDSHGVTGGVYKARERIHRGMLIRDY